MGPDMIHKTFLAAAALLEISAMGTGPAKADIYINIGFSGGYHRKISCGTGALGLWISVSTAWCRVIAAALIINTRAAATANGTTSP